MLSFAAHTFRVVDLSGHGELVVRKASDGHAQPCMSALEANDIHVRFVLQAGQTDINNRELICVPECLSGRLYETATCNQVRWCRRCETWLHVACLNGQRVDDVKHYDERLGTEFEQSYLTYLWDPRRRRLTKNFKIEPLDLAQNNRDTDYHWDVDDTKNRYPLLATPLAEIACLPIRRRSFPGYAPETNELLIQYAIQRVQSGRVDPDEKLPDLGEDDWFHREVDPKAGLRAVKYILRKDLYELRTGRMRWYLCIKCDKQIV
ncbi:hypothetical protein EV121DRAFT_217514 [Schizophyllum commune]